jgi:SnoaL-like domain
VQEKEELMSESVRDLVMAYVAAAGERRFDRLAELVHPEATFGGTVKGETHGRDSFVQGFRNLGPIIARNEIRELIVEGNRASVLYDFVTDTAVGPVLSAEFVNVEDGLIRSSTLLFDHRRWPEVVQELKERTGVAASPQPAKA